MLPMWMIWFSGIVGKIIGLCMTCGLGLIAVAVALIFIAPRYDKEAEDYHEGGKTHSTYKRIASEGRKCLKKCAIIGTILLTIGLVTPNKETMYLMMVNSQLTTENLEGFTDGAKGVIDYTVEKIGELTGSNDTTDSNK